jgi:hypothetical protein
MAAPLHTYTQLALQRNAKFGPDPHIPYTIILSRFARIGTGKPASREQIGIIIFTHDNALYHMFMGGFSICGLARPNHGQSGSYPSCDTIH